MNKLKEYEKELQDKLRETFLNITEKENNTFIKLNDNTFVSEAWNKCMKATVKACVDSFVKRCEEDLLKFK